MEVTYSNPFFHTSHGFGCTYAREYKIDSNRSEGESDSQITKLIRESRWVQVINSLNWQISFLN